MGLLSSLLSNVFSALGLGGGSGAQAPSVETVATVGAEMNQAVSQSIDEAGILTGEGLGYAGGTLVSTVTKAASLLTGAISQGEIAIPALLDGDATYSAQQVVNTLSANGSEAGTIVAGYASGMPLNVATGIAHNVASFSTVPIPTDIGGYLFY